MSSRYLRATGNWNGPVWAETSDGAAGSAATPTNVDNVNITANFTVTVTADAECFQFYQSNGTLTLSSYTLVCQSSFYSTGSTSRTINLNSGVLHVGDGTSYTSNVFSLGGSNLTFNAGTSLVRVKAIGWYSPPVSYGQIINTLGKTFNDFILEIGSPAYSDSNQVNITGSPTFRSLIIQSKNSAAHTVQGNGEWQVDKFVAIGSSSSSRLTLGSIPGYLCSLKVKDLNTFSVYGQYVVPGIGIVTPSGGTLPSGYPTYIGSNSISGGYAGWLYQDPPKISTLVDPLTTAPGSNPNWTVSGTINTRTDGKDGGGYGISGTAVER